MRKRVKGILIRVTDDEFHETIKQLRAIGNNINQIAMVANKTGAIDATMYHDERIKLNNEILTIRKIASRPIEMDGGNKG